MRLTKAGSNEPAFQGIEKAFFYRICKSLTRNIQLIFVFDGPGVPAKRGKNGGRKIEYERSRLLKQMLRCFGVPYQEAPGEAEAECARLQILGLVDAVWSQDSDCLMFGCSLWLHDDRVAKEKGNKDRSKENTKKSDRYVRIVRAKDMKDRLNLDREGLVLFAMLVGGDYHPTGLPGCGAGIALAAVREGNLAHALCLCRNQRDCADWSIRLAGFLQTKPRARNLRIPAGFPDFKILQKYYKPKVTSDELLQRNESLNLAVARPIREHELLEVTSSRFNIWGRLYMNWVGPVLLMQSLLRRNISQTKEVVHDIKLTKQHVSKSEEVTALRLWERKITFSPFGVTSLRKEDFEGGEREGMWEGKRDMPFDSTYRVECDYLPVYWLQRVLPPDIFNPPPHAPKQKGSKRKAQSEADNGATLSPAPEERKKKKQRAQRDDPAVAATLHPAESSGLVSGDDKPSTQARRRRLNGKQKIDDARPVSSKPSTQQYPTNKLREVIDLSSLDDDIMLRHPPRRQTIGTTSAGVSLPNIVDLGSPEPSADESDDDLDLARAIRLSMQSPHQQKELANVAMPLRDVSMAHTPSYVQTPYSPPKSTLSATEISTYEDNHEARGAKFTCTAAKLDQIRTARLKHYMSNAVTTPEQTTPAMKGASSARKATIDCIDLTRD